MKIYENGVIRDATTEEIAAMQEAAARAKAEEKHRPYTLGEVQELLIRQHINTLTVDDATAYRMKAFYPAYEVGKAYATGDKFIYAGELYRVLQSHTSQESWTPGAGTESLYVHIDEQHDGTKYDPIPYNGNMALESGKYYSQGGVTYLCNRDTGIAVYQPLADLVGVYVEEVAA